MFGARGEGAETEDVGAVAEEDCFFAWEMLVNALGVVVDGG